MNSINHIRSVYYEDFGAVGNGVHDDFDAIEATHKYANEHGLSVKAKERSTYYIGANFTRSIPVDTDTDFCGAHIIIDDSVSNAFTYRTLPLFLIKRKSSFILKTDDIKKLGKDIRVKRSDTSFPWLLPLLVNDSLVRLINDQHRDFVRFGSNEDAGTPRQDIFLVRRDGSLDPSTPVAFEFDILTSIEIFPIEEDSITIKNGHFFTICCRSCAETDFKNLYRSFSRGFRIERSNVNLENITHEMTDEPPFVTNSGMDSLSAIFGERNESYPYHGFIVCSLANAVTLKDCILAGHTTYYEDKPATESTAWVVPNPVPMGSYDFYFHYSNAISLVNVRQNSPFGIGDHRYWGIMASNNCKNLHLESCFINRFDAHRGFWNASIKNSVIGHSINITGGGLFLCENVRRVVGDQFLSIRGDYGASFDGDILLRNCHICAYPAYSSARGERESSSPLDEAFIIAPSDATKKEECELYYNWDFGYELFLPKNITLENFTHGAKKGLYIYTDLCNEKFVNPYKHHHRLTKKISLIGMDDIPRIAKGDECTELFSIPLIIEEKNSGLSC